MKFIDHEITQEVRPDGALILGSAVPLGLVARSVGQWLKDWAARTPDAVFIAERAGAGWREMTYGAMLEAVEAVAAALLARGLGPGKPVAFLSGPGVDAAILSLAAQHIGAPVAPLAEQYSLIPDARARLLYTLGKIRPAMVFAADAGRFASALAEDALAGVEKVAVATAGAPGAVTPFADLLKGDGAADVAAAFAAVGPDTVAKILFTSGSTSDPKGAPQTQGMMTVNQAQYQACLPLLTARPPKMLDWLPWNHVFAANSNFNMILANGGALYLDGGKPMKGLFDQTLANIRDHAGTISCNVPIAYALLAEAMRADTGLRRAFFADLDMIFYAGASLSPDIWRALERMALEERGAAPFMTSCWGMTETAPAAIFNHQQGGEPGAIGVPLPGLEAKLTPQAEGRYALLVRGPQVIPEYLDDPARTAEAFDDEGFFITGDAVRMIDPADPARGLTFDGRLSEDFKLATGTWVHASALRLKALAALAGFAQDVVVTGEGRGDVGLLIFPAPGALAADAAQDGGAATHPAALARVGAALAAMAEGATGSSNRIARALVLAEPPSVRDAEITAKGSLNNAAVLTRRAALVARLYDDGDPATIRA